MWQGQAEVARSTHLRLDADNAPRLIKNHSPVRHRTALLNDLCATVQDDVEHLSFVSLDCCKREPPVQDGQLLYVPGEHDASVRLKASAFYHRR